MRALALALLVACGPKYTGSGITSPQRETPYLGDNHRVYIPFMREHYDSYHDDGSVICGMLAGKHECESDSSETTEVEDLGVVEVDLVTGACSLLARPRGRKHPRASELQAGDRVFTATRDDGIFETTTTRKVARHVPTFLIPTAYTKWMTAQPWPVNWTFADATLVRDDGRLYMQNAYGRTLLANRDVTVQLFGDRYVFAGDTLLDLKRFKSTTALPGIRRLGEYQSDLLVEGDDGDYYRVYPDLMSVSRYTVRLEPIGVDRNELVFEHPYTILKLLAFDVTNRSWRELSLASCMPQE